eukprot:3668401-Lingulodinium_polyedra.AAC.1
MLPHARCSPVMRTLERARAMQIHWRLAKPFQTQTTKPAPGCTRPGANCGPLPPRSKIVQRRALS